MIGVHGYPWALRRLGLNYVHETFSNRNSIERWFRELKDRTKRFYNNINTKTVKKIEEMGKAIALIHNLLLQTKTQVMERGGVIPG